MYAFTEREKEMKERIDEMRKEIVELKSKLDQGEVYSQGVECRSYPKECPINIHCPRSLELCGH